jgi:hypothetical protein
MRPITPVACQFMPVDAAHPNSHMIRELRKMAERRAVSSEANGQKQPDNQTEATHLTLRPQSGRRSTPRLPVRPTGSESTE